MYVVRTSCSVSTRSSSRDPEGTLGNPKMLRSKTGCIILPAGFGSSPRATYLENVRPEAVQRAS